MTGDIAVGTKVFKRSEKLEQLLSSIPNYVKTVYVADDGSTNERSDIYTKEYQFDLKVLDLEYDKGLGAGRRAIVDEFTEEYLTIVDADHKIPENLDLLRGLLDENDQLGGVSGAILEPNEQTYYITGQFLKEEGKDLHRGPRVEKDIVIDEINGNSVLYFDFIANAAMFRRECLESYSWDPEYVIGYEHIDFYVGHWKTTKWKFGVCPSVIFKHYPGGSSEYNENRESANKLNNSKDYFLEKWEFEKDVRRGFRWARGPPTGSWYFRGEMNMWQKGLAILVFDGPMELIKRIKVRIQRM